MKQTLICVGDPLKKLVTKDKTKPLGSQKVRPKNGQLEVKWFKHFVVPFGMGKCQSHHVLLHPKK